MRCRWRRRRRCGGVAAGVDDLGQEPCGDHGSDAVEVGQGAAGGCDQVGDLAFEGGCFGVDGQDPVESAAEVARTLVGGDQLEDAADPGPGDQAAGSGAGSRVPGRSARRGPGWPARCVRRAGRRGSPTARAGPRPGRRSVGPAPGRVAGGDPGDRQRVDRVGLALADLGASFP